MLNVRVYVEQAATGLWLAILCTHQGHLHLRGYLSHAAAVSAARDVAINVYGRVPYFVEA